MELLPTGTCFDDAAELFVHLLKDLGYKPGSGPYLVHAIIDSDFEDKKISHAWVECGEMGYIVGVLNGERVMVEGTIKEIRSNMKIHEFSRYDPYQVKRYCQVIGDTSGPWEKKYLELCKDYESTANHSE